MSRNFDFPTPQVAHRRETTAGVTAGQSPTSQGGLPAAGKAKERLTAEGSNSQGGKLNRKLGLVRGWQRAVQIGATTALGLALTGCVALLPVPSVLREDSGVVTSEAEAEAVQPATFDPNDPNFRFFDPCHDLTEDDFESIGLPRKPNWEPVKHEYPFAKCDYAVKSGAGERIGTVWIYADILSLEDNRDQIVLLDYETTGVLPNSVAYQFQNETYAYCAIVIPTDGGRLHVGYDPFFVKGDPIYSCQQAETYLKKIIEVRGGLNANSI